jgi:ribosomal-protein-alanine N-acetyltransferase
MSKTEADIPTRIEAERLYLRRYERGDGPWYYAMGLRNRDHLARYETDNPARSLHSEQEAEMLMHDLATDWDGRLAFFLGAFDRASDEFVAQIYIGPMNWALPEFAVGYFVDRGHEGQGFVAEAVRASLGFIFQYLGAHRVCAECDDTNLRSARVLERCGFVREGHFRENKRHPDGTISGTLHFGLLRSDIGL